MFRQTAIVFAIAVIFINLSAALQCYICAGTASSDCAQGKKSAMGVQQCPNVNYSMTFSSHLDYVTENDVDSKLKDVCLKFTMTNVQPNIVLRECGVFLTNVDPCDFLQKHAPVKQCKSCTTDQCNARVEDPVVDMML